MRKPRILVADDDRIGRSILRRLLENHGCDVVECAAIDNALASISEAETYRELQQHYRGLDTDEVAIDAVLTDYDFGDEGRCTGERIAELALSSGSKPPVIMISSDYDRLRSQANIMQWLKDKAGQFLLMNKPAMTYREQIITHLAAGLAGRTDLDLSGFGQPPAPTEPSRIVSFPGGKAVPGS